MAAQNARQRSVPDFNLLLRRSQGVRVSWCGCRAPAETSRAKHTRAPVCLPLAGFAVELTLIILPVVQPGKNDAGYKAAVFEALCTPRHSIIN